MSVPITAKNLRGLMPGPPREEGEKWDGLMAAQPRANLGEPLTHAWYKIVPVILVPCL